MVNFNSLNWSFQSCRFAFSSSFQDLHQTSVQVELIFRVEHKKQKTIFWDCLHRFGKGISLFSKDLFLKYIFLQSLDSLSAAGYNGIYEFFLGESKYNRWSRLHHWCQWWRWWWPMTMTLVISRSLFGWAGHTEGGDVLSNVSGLNQHLTFLSNWKFDLFCQNSKYFPPDIERKVRKRVLGVEGNLLFRVFFLPQKIGDLDEAELIEIPLDQVKTKEKTKTHRGERQRCLQIVVDCMPFCFKSVWRK